MKKNVYQKPTMKTVRLHQRAMLLQASGGEGNGVRSSRDNYGEAITEDWN